MDLLDYIPPFHHEFFKSLKTAKDINDIGPLEVINENLEEDDD